MMSQSVEEALLELRLEDMEMSLLRAHQQVRNVIAHARCAICGEYIDDQRWHLGELGEEQEIVHTECYDKAEAEERARAQGVEGDSYQAIFEGTEQAYRDGSGSGEHLRAPEALAGAQDAGRVPAEETATAEGLSTDAGEHGGVRHQSDAQGQRAPVHVAGYRGPDSVSVSERMIDTGGEPITVRVPRWKKHELSKEIKGEPVHYGTAMPKIDRIKRFLMMNGII